MSRPLSAGEQRLLDCLHDARDQLRELMQRWDNRLTGEESVAEEYIKGRLSIGFQMKLGDIATEPHAARDRGKSDGGAIVLSVKHRKGNGWDQQSVLVHLVEVVQSANGLIPSLASIGLYLINNQVDDVCTSNLYRSVMNGAYKLLSGVAYWESNILNRSAGVGDNIVGHMIKRSPQVVDCITDDQWDGLWHRFRDVEFHRALTRLRVFLGANTIKVTLQEGDNLLLQIEDVLIGPFDL